TLPRVRIPLSPPISLAALAHWRSERASRLPRPASPVARGTQTLPSPPPPPAARRVPAVRGARVPRLQHAFERAQTPLDEVDRGRHAPRQIGPRVEVLAQRPRCRLI